MNPLILTNQYLIAMPQMADPNFHHTTTYMCEHNDEGAMGLIINRPLNINLTEVLSQIDIDVADPSLTTMPVYYGGPVQEDRGFVLHRPGTTWESTIIIGDQLAITTSKDILHKIAEGSGPSQYLVTLGYAGWGAGQLEMELADNAWLNGPANTSIMFDTPTEERWSEAAKAMGIDLNLISGDTGHA
ncbi:MAG: YqgE/AlgH family protein [Gammaproteobacteria bacterium]|nr:YqgE/AlgH family protein [Gammaproteobacteria bacterium]